MELREIVARMANALRHRGPDDQGRWADADAGMALAHRRLAIQDLSQEGHQPMISADSKFVLVFNGEIYNFLALREELHDLGYTFRGHSDTEVLLAGFCEWGFRQTVQRCVGMFAIALWDCKHHQLHLARDRAGEKPLYYGWAGDVFMFGSELKALRAHPRWREDIDRGSVALLTRFGYIPAPLSIYEHIYKLPPGCILTLNERQHEARKIPFPEPYWSLQSVAENGVSKPFPGNESEAIEQLRNLLLQSVAQQMIADVPLGAFLSGGIDSSLVVAAMQVQSRRPIKTFTIGFQQASYDEAPYARKVAQYLGTNHTELYVQPSELLKVVSRLPRVYDEPFADTSQIPTILLCELARSQVTVSLSGDAGDELFAGYETYPKAQRIWSRISRLPPMMRSGAAAACERVAASGLNLPILPAGLRDFLGRLANFSEVLPARSDRELYKLLMSPNRGPLPWLKNKQEPATPFDEVSLWEQFPGLLHRMMSLDFVSYLPDDILVKVDRAAMAVSLETRIPLLDHRIIEFAWTLPNSLKERRGRGKWLLRKLLHQYVPPALVERPKKGFGVPIAEWLRGPLREWAEALLNGKRLREEGFFDEGIVRKKWTEHLGKKRDWGTPLWHLLMFQAWLEQDHNSTLVPEAANLASPAAACFDVCQP